MEKDHIKLQFRRLKKHYEECVNNIDEVHMLDLAHTLRIWVEIAKDIDELIKEEQFKVKFSNPTKNKEIEEVLKGSAFMYIPLASCPKTNTGMQVSNIIFIKKMLSAEEAKKLYEAGKQEAKNVELSFTEWLGSEILETKNKKGERIGIARNILIKRVANLLGASHPQEKDNAEEYEHRFDPFIKDLHTLIIANGYPSTYYQLIEIAEVIINSLKNLLE